MLAYEEDNRECFQNIWQKIKGKKNEIKRYLQENNWERFNGTNK
jgi:hypothetical protein